MNKEGYVVCTVMLVVLGILTACTSTTPAAAEPTITVLNYPAEVADNQPFVVSWKVQGSSSGTITHTALHFDYEPHGPNFQEYREVSAVYTGTAPQEFSGTIHALKVGFIYFRAHTIVDGKHIYSEEKQIAVQPYVGATTTEDARACPSCLEPSTWSSCSNSRQSRIVYVCNERTNYLCQDRTQEQPCVDETRTATPAAAVFSIDVNDQQFSPALIEAKAGQTVRITFHVISPSTFGGADIREPNGLVKTGKILPGEQKTAEFVMPATEVTLTNYWPARSVKKADMKIKVAAGSS